VLVRYRSHPRISRYPMTSLTKVWNDFSIRIRTEDRYVCLTDMAKATGKLYADWARLTKTKSYLETLSSVMGIPIATLIQVQQGGVPEAQGTWGHPKVAIRFAQWCSDEFAVQVDFWVDELLTTGKVELRPQQQLPPADVRIDKLVTNLEKIGIDITNPRFKQDIQDLVMDKIIGGKTLSQSNEIWLGVVEKAEELGYSPALVAKHRSQLGKFVASFGLESKKEKRLCTGTLRPINLYKDCLEFEEAIKEFMDAKVLAM